VPGIEEVAWLEIRERFPQAKFGEFMFAKDERGVVLFEYGGPLSDLFTLRTIEGAFLVATYMGKISRGYRDLRQMQEQLVDRGDLGRAVNALTRFRRRQPGSYRLIVKKYGQHEYDRNAFRKAIIQSIEAFYPQWERVQKDHDVEIWANVFGSSILIGLRLPSPRGWHSRQHETLPESVAAALSLLSQPQAGDRFLDPICESGEVLEARSTSAAQLIVGGDFSADDVQSARRNGGRGAELLRWDAALLPLRTASIDKAATRFPAGDAAQLSGRYSEWLAELQRVLRPGGRAVILTRNFELFKNVIRDHPELQVRGGYSVTVHGEWGRIYVVDRLS
jgi:SAM-dependent methyltransferase